MGRFRRRKPTVAWLPHVTHNEQTPAVGWWDGAFTVPNTVDTTSTQIFSLVPDYPAEAVRATTELPSLADFEGSGYRLRRIVGKLFAGIEQVVPQGADTNPPVALLGAGIIVLKVEESTGAPLVTTANHYSPLDNDSTSDPWIWRRTWLLGNDFGLGATQSIISLPRWTTEYGSASDGPHIDQKTARRIAKEERLFFVLSCANPFITTTQNGSGYFLLDYRILASPIKVMGNRRNASR